MTTVVASSRPTSYWIIATLALVWNLIGVYMFYMQMSAGTAQMAALPPEQQQIIEATPTWLNAAYGVAVFGGAFGAIGLLMKKRWAVALFQLSLAALVVQIAGTFVVTPAWGLLGPIGLAMPALILVIALFLLSYASKAAARRWIG
ncbi:hypothetical protein MNR01_13615 [Lysobacter sp. S4-A87]|uniref:hypothetical protein n=1 Tax=Lysobacter sp. S4-A87 TaxID=2925843 RepID=UPI001F52FB21|nr:hypothetical protein [Lysobacter sp. S4-A87]UNK48770.1 hypothetical protein MNR01_13615 [Lysobacter sp. S4-A87]